MDLSKLPDSQRQELEQLQKQFQEHQQKQQQSALQQQQPQPQPPPPDYDPFHLHQPYVPSQPYDHSYYYNYQHPPQQQPQQQQQQQHQSHLHQYDTSYYQNYYSNSYQQHHYTAPNEQQRNAESGYGSGSLGLGHTYGNQVNPGNPGPPGINPTAAAAAVAALSQLTHFAGSMAGGGGGGGHYDQGHFRPPVGHTLYRGRGRRGGGPFRGGGRGNSGFWPANTGVSGPLFRGPGRDRDRGRGRRDRRGPPLGAPSSHPESSANANAQPPVRTAWCEVCKTDCTTDEVLDQHNNGKRHKRNVQKLQRMKSATAHQPVVLVQTEKDEKPGSDIGPEVQENIPETEPDKQAEVAEVAEVGDDSNKVETEENDNQEKKHRMKRKMKRSIRGARGGGAKRMRVAGPRIRKVVIPLVCDLCNIKCDTQEVFDRHTSGKKHRSKLRRFEGHQAMYGPTAVQALYPPNPLSHSLGPQPPAYNGASSSYLAPPEAYIPPPYQAQNPNPQLADAPLEFGTHNAVLTG